MRAPFVRVGDLAEQVRGVTYRKTDASMIPKPGYLPVLRAGNITDEGLVFSDLVFVPAERISNKQKVRRYDVVIAASSGSLDVVGKAAPALADYEGGFGAFCKVLRPKSGVNPGYFAHFFKTQDYRRHVSSLAAGANINNLRNEHLDELQIPLPPLAEQQQVAEVLDRAEALRAKRRAALSQLDTLSQAIFIKMFGYPLSNSKGWPKIELRQVTEIITGYPFRSEEYVSLGDGVRLCRGTNVLPGRLDWSDLACWPKSKVGPVSEFTLCAGDVVLAMDRPWISEGFKIAQARESDCSALLVQRVARIRGKDDVPNDFVFHLLNHPAFSRHCRPTETTVPHISPKEIRSFSFYLPPIPLQHDFARRVAAVEKLKAAHRASLAELDALFASLQHRAFRGEL